MRAILIALVLILAAVGGYALKEFAGARDTPDTAAINQAIGQYLKDHPAEVLDAARMAQASAQQNQEAVQRLALEQQANQIFNNPVDPVVGNPDGDVTVVEFFDYRCPYCKQVTDSLTELVRSDGKIRLVFKELPILSPESVIAAKIALAAQKQGKYEPVHVAFMRHKGSFEEAVLLELAASVGADPQRLQEDMKDPAIIGQLEANAALAHALGISGTPGFLFGKQLVPGAISLQEMKAKVASARAQAG